MTKTPPLPGHPARSESKSFFQTVPGCLTALTGLITALAGLIAALHQIGVIGPSSGPGPADPGRAVELERRVEALSAESRRERTRELEARIAEMERELSRRNGSSPQSEPTIDAGVHLGGTWYGGNGLTYVVTQTGNQVTFQEVGNVFGMPQVLAAGQGTIHQRQVQLQFVALDGSQGTMTLRVANHGNTMNGAIVNPMYGTRVPITMSR